MSVSLSFFQNPYKKYSTYIRMYILFFREINIPEPRLNFDQ